MQELSSDGWLIAGANESMRDSGASVAVIYPLPSYLVLAARGDRPARQEEDSHWLVCRWELAVIFIPGARKSMFGRDHLFGFFWGVITSRMCWHLDVWMGEQKFPEQVRLMIMSATWSVRKYDGGTRWPKIYSRQSYIKWRQRYFLTACSVNSSII